MNWIDVAIIGILFIELIEGVISGFNLAIFKLGCWLVATIIGLNFNSEFSVFLESSLTHTTTRIIVSFIALFLITLMVAHLIRILLGSLLKKPKLSILNRLGGLICGGLHGVLNIVILITLAGLTHLPENIWWDKSRLRPPFQIVAIWLKEHIPSELTEHIHYQ